jgi:ATP-dependent DNA helicase PIF1
MTQQDALAILKTGRNVFLTGEPGAGKTYTINQYVSWLRDHGIEPAITASTGIAATHIGGMTIHSWSGIGIKRVLNSQDFERLRENDKLVTRLAVTSVLIIDEISMLDARTLDAVDSVCRALRQDGRAFGGIQVVFVGDFFQLPPVSSPEEERPEFAFRSQAWQDAEPTVCYLSEQHRQQDGAFLSLLSGIRRGSVDADGIALLQSRQVELDDDESHTRLYAHNLDVDRLNQQRLNAIEDDERVFEMESHGPTRYTDQIKKHCLSPERLALKTGARVMFTKNHPEGRYVNGTLGEINRFTADGAPVVRTLSGQEITPTSTEWAIRDGDRVLAKVVQLPLRLAWAITIHKSQGLTLDRAAMDLSRVFEYGQGYVALSRVRSSDGLYLSGWNSRALQVHPHILASDAEFRRLSAEARASSDTVPAGMRSELEQRFIQASGGSLELITKKEPVLKEKKTTAPKGATYEETLTLFQAGKSVKEIAEVRDFVESTIWSHLEKLAADGRIGRAELVPLIPKHLRDNLPLLHQTLQMHERRLTPAVEQLGGRYSFEDLRLARMVME